MINSRYIKRLIAIRRIINNRIDNEIEDALRGKNRESAENLVESLIYQIEENARFLKEDERNGQIETGTS